MLKLVIPKKLGKSQNKVGVADAIGWENDIILSKIGRGGVLINPSGLLKQSKSRIGVWMDGCKSRFKDCLQLLKTFKSDKSFFGMKKSEFQKGLWIFALKSSCE